MSMRKKEESCSRQGCEVQIVDSAPQLGRGKIRLVAGFWQTPCSRSSFEWSSAMEIATDQPIQV